MSYANLNIKTADKAFKYIVEYYDDPDMRSEQLRFYSNELGYFIFNDNQKNVSHDRNYWTPVVKSQTGTDDTLPSVYNVSSFDLYFPRYSVETYEHNVNYVLTINTWINGVAVYLGSHLINRVNAIASEKGPRKFLNDDYYEHIKINTIDPFYLIYGDEWKSFREKFCLEKVGENGYQKNNSVSNINITLTPVKLIDGIWVKMDGYDSTQSVIAIQNKKNNFMRAVLKFNMESNTPKFICDVHFNELYVDEHDTPDFTAYLKETYQINFENGYFIDYGFIIGDHEDPYKYVKHTYETPVDHTEFDLEEFKFDSWEDYVEGMCASVFVVIRKGEDEVIVVTSNKVFIEQEVFKYLMDMPIRKVNLDDIDMELKNYDVVNIIKNEIVTVERPNDYKANIIKPVFIKSQESDTIRLHRSVTEHISINLDAYKNKVDAFVLKIGDGNFYEMGRVNTGIVFKVIGSQLPEEDGIYYILNTDGELVTTGNYTLL